jgi:hypothetical protein
VAGGLAAAAGVVLYLSVPSENPDVHPVTAAELLRIERPGSLPGWVCYNPARAFDTGVEYAKITSRQITSRFLLLPVGDRWLLTEVAGQFTGLRFEGKLGQPDPIALRRVTTAYPNLAGRLLPYQLDARLDSAGTRLGSFCNAGAAGLSGVLLFSAGARGFLARPLARRARRSGPSSVFRRRI